MQRQFSWCVGSVNLIPENSVPPKARRELATIKLLMEIPLTGEVYPFTPTHPEKKRKRYMNPKLVRVVVPDRQIKWVIWYGNEDATGPFDSRVEAEKWYNGGGR